MSRKICKLSTITYYIISSVTLKNLFEGIKVIASGQFGAAMNTVSYLKNNVATFSAVTTEGITTLASAVQGLTFKDQALILAQNEITESSIAQALAINGASSADIAAAMSTITHTNATAELTAAQLEASLALQFNNQEKAAAVTAELAKIAADENGVIVTEKLTYADLKNTAAITGMTTAEMAGTAATLGMSSAMVKLRATIAGIWTSIKMLAPQLIAVTALIAAVVVAYKQINKADQARKRAAEQAQKRQEQYEDEIATAKQMVKQYSESTQSLKEYAERYEKLNKKISLSNDDKNELIEIQNKLIDTYGEEAKGIDLVNGKYEENIQLIEQLTQKEREKARQSALAVYLDAKRNGHIQGESGGAYVFDQYTGTSKRTDYKEDNFFGQDIEIEADKVYKRLMTYFEAIQLMEEQTFGDGSYWGSLTTLTLNPNLSNDELIKAIDSMIDIMDKEFDQNDKQSTIWQQYYKGLIDLRNKAEEYKQGISDNLANLAQTTIEAYSLDGIDFSTVTEKTYQKWHDGLIAQFASNDPDLQKAIEEKLQSMFDWLGGGKDKTTVAFDWSTFADENGLEDIEKLLGKIQTAYKNLEETGNGFALDSDILNAFPELAEYLDDVDTLKTKLQELSDAQMQPLIDQLKEIQSTLDPSSSDYSSIENIIKWLQQQADVTQKIKEKTQKTSDLYKDQKLQIHENITALEREVKTIDKQISALEKKKDLQEKYIKTLEKEKDRLEDLIDDYETAASTVKDFIDEQNDALEKQKDNIEDTYEAQIKAIEETYDKQVKLLEAQEKGFDKQIKALQDEADEQNRLNDLKEKELALEKAKNEKVRVYTAEKGWQVVQNSEAIAAARKELEEAQHENKIAELEKEKERLESEKERLQTEKEQRTSELEAVKDKQIAALQAEMDKLKEYKTAWEEAIGAYKKAQDEMTTAAILGADWRTKLAEQDKTIIEDYKNGYEGVQNQLNNSVIPMIELANKELDTYSEQIDKLKEQKDLYKDMEDNQKKYLDFYKTYAEQFADATKEQSDAVEALNKALATNTLLTNMDNTDKAWDWAKSLFDEDYIREYPDYKGDKTASSVSLISRLTDIFNKSTSVYDSFVKSIPNLLNKTLSDLSGEVIAGAKLIADRVTNNKSNTDNRTQTINFNNPGFAMTYADFEPMFMETLRRLDQQAQTGKR